MGPEDKFYEYRGDDGKVTSRCWRIILSFTNPIGPDDLDQVLADNKAKFPPKPEGFERTEAYEIEDSGKNLRCEFIDKRISFTSGS